MESTARRGPLKSTVAVPVLALAMLAAAWTHHDNPVTLAVIAAFLIGAVLSAVHHAEVVALRVGEPAGSLVLAVAVTIIEVGLIVMLMAGGGPGAPTYARDTVFAAVMITLNGIVGLSLIVSSGRRRVASFNASGSGAALATVVTLAGVTLVLPGFTHTRPGLEYASSQLVFAGVTSLALYSAFVVTQTVRHRGFFLPEQIPDHDGDGHSDPPSNREAGVSLGLLMAALVSVIGLAKLISPAIDATVTGLGLPHAVVGVLIAMVVLAPESIAAFNNARRERVQISLNLAYGSAMASIGLTIPVIALAMIWLPGPLALGLEPMQIVLLTLTVIVSILTLSEGIALALEGLVHLMLLATFLFLSAQP